MRRLSRRSVHAWMAFSLAIELAAVRVKLLSPEQIAARLDDRFRMLTGGSRTALPRQQTLRALVDWSYSLLSEAERVLLRRLAVFAGGWSLEAAQDVCGGDAVDEYELLDLLAHLVDKSLVVVENRTGSTRYRMLETIRQYAREKLLDSGQGEGVRDEHLQYYMRFAETAELKLQGPGQVAWLNQLETELDNIRAAIEWALQRDDTTPGLRLASALWFFWFTHSHRVEAAARLRELLARPDAHKRTALRAKSLLAAHSLSRLISGYSEAGLPRVEEALSIGHEIAEPFIVAWSLVQIVFLAVMQEDYARASALVDESIAIFQTCGLRWYVAFVLNSKGNIAARQGNRTAALAAFAQSAEILRALGDKNMLAPPLRGLARLELAGGQPERAATLFAESLTLNIEVGDARGTLCSLAGLVSVAIARGEFVRAAQLSAAVVALEESRHTRLLVVDRDAYTHAVGTLRAELDPAAFEHAWAEGRMLTMEHTIGLALDSES
jgi:tetratricopeptide (TPR) repeat protein